MEIGTFGLPGSDMLVFGILFGGIGLVMLSLGIAVAFFVKDSFATGVLGLIAAVFLIPSLILLPIGHGRENKGHCFSELPATTLAVDGAFNLNTDNLYVVVSGKKKEGGNNDMVRSCAILLIGTVKGYPGEPVTTGEYLITTEKHKSSGLTWTTHTFMPVNANK